MGIKKSEWVIEGKVKDLDTGDIYELSGTTFDRSDILPTGHGLALKKFETKEAYVNRVDTEFSPNGLAKCIISAVAKLDNWELME